MKRKAFIKHLNENNCILVREGSNHSLYMNSKNGKKSTVGRHSELSNQMCKIICKQLDISPI
ncbi:type II toxin-antitoxin system HicA family toxin [Tangfeifania diversioriginum]|uniref:type II toxin-antitoxin system HicA family toxin n=1 Tax=Tangfeifania diversioriginum TaxID=1168035 RepID=UPI0009326B88